ncbi:MAG TPA: GNAT family N-acetyltransferase [Stackebrandtia sp.]|jgi:RimJ/RimL family protein N-acetyltransferase|uniref:GNAT family N-acetyltransferase n=1 Tax=Stackebrandtia sp. TaxID=2023065 RepID=UPI002D23EA95|nr:GNAT family N-acetyltransferase [Stackebrandtia sp.]HZE37234.1 GNAT family N-acetyltransferase [Stackebrandtia sp.]
MSVNLLTDATATTPALRLRPWRPHDAPTLVTAHRDSAMRQWLLRHIATETEALQWIDAMTEAWAADTRYTFAILDGTDKPTAPPLGSIAVKMTSDFAPNAAEVGYWTSGAARGRGIASTALAMVSDWIPTIQPALDRLELLHSVGNAASCRVAEKSGYPLEAELPPFPPDFPNPGHLHVRVLKNLSPRR